MSQKTIFLLLLVFVLLALIASYPVWHESIGFFRKPEIKPELDFSSLNENSVNKVIIKKDQVETILEKHGQSWLVNGFTSSQPAVDEFFQALTLLQVDALVSRNPANQAQYEIDEKNGHLIVFFQNNQEESFLIGKSGVGLDSFYAKKQDSPNVYLVKGYLQDKLTQTISNWRDRVLIAVNSDQISKIVVSGKDNFKVVKNGAGEWQIEAEDKTTTLENQEAETILEIFARLEGYDFADDTEKTQFDRAAKARLEILDSQDQVLAGLNLAKTDSGWLAQLQNSDEILKVYLSTLDSLFGLVSQPPS